MQQLPKITRILDITPFQIAVLWGTGDAQTIDFEALFALWKIEGDSKMAPLQDWDAFRQVVLSENGTLCWPNILVPFSYKGKTRTEPLELDAQVLYRQGNGFAYQKPTKAKTAIA